LRAKPLRPGQFSRYYYCGGQPGQPDRARNVQYFRFFMQLEYLVSGMIYKNPEIGNQAPGFKGGPAPISGNMPNRFF
jgi:hypothetical protein